jgi:hypothetical protein
MARDPMGNRIDLRTVSETLAYILDDLHGRRELEAPRRAIAQALTEIRRLERPHFSPPSTPVWSSYYTLEPENDVADQDCLNDCHRTQRLILRR